MLKGMDDTGIGLVRNKVAIIEMSVLLRLRICLGDFAKKTVFMTASPHTWAAPVSGISASMRAGVGTPAKSLTVELERNGDWGVAKVTGTVQAARLSESKVSENVVY